MEADFVCFVKLTLKIDIRVSLGQFVLGSDEVGIKVVDTKCCLELIIRSIRSRFGVNSKSLMGKVSILFVGASMLLSARTSRKSSKSRFSSAFSRASQASSADMSATRDVSRTRFASHSMVWCPRGGVRNQP